MPSQASELGPFTPRSPRPPPARQRRQGRRCCSNIRPAWSSIYCYREPATGPRRFFIYDPPLTSKSHRDWFRTPRRWSHKSRILSFRLPGKLTSGATRRSAARLQRPSPANASRVQTQSYEYHAGQSRRFAPGIHSSGPHLAQVVAAMIHAAKLNSGQSRAAKESQGENQSSAVRRDIHRRTCTLRCPQGYAAESPDSEAVTPLRRQMRQPLRCLPPSAANCLCQLTICRQFGPRSPTPVLRSS